MRKTESYQVKKKQHLAIAREGIQCLPKDPLLWNQKDIIPATESSGFHVHLRCQKELTVVLKGFIKHLLDWDVWEEAGSSVSLALPVFGGISVPG